MTDGLLVVSFCSGWTIIAQSINMPQKKKTTPKKKASTPTPKKNKSGTTRWSKYGPHAAQLFRDIYFGKYKRGDDGEFDIDTIFNDPNRNYSELTPNSFYGHVDDIAERVESYRTRGTGLGTQAFRELVNLSKIPPAEDRASNIGDDGNEKEEEALSSSDSDDSSYFGAKEDDISLDSEFEEEDTETKEEEEETKPKAKAKNTPKKTPSKTASKKTPAREVEHATKMATKDDTGDIKYMYKLPDGRVCCVFQLTSGCEGNFEFNKGKSKTKIILKRQMPRWAYSAHRVFRRKGLDPNNANVVGLQNIMDKTRKKDIEAMGMDPDTYTGAIYRTREIFDVAKVGVNEVLPFFLDELGHQTTDIYADANVGAEWVFFWLKDKDAVQESHPGGRIVRNNRRSRDGNDDDQRPRARASGDSQDFADAMSQITL